MKIRSQPARDQRVYLVPGSNQNDRPPMVVAMHWVSQITAISLMAVLPAVGGNWLDERWDTGPWLVGVGAVLGSIVAMRQLLALTSSSQPQRKPDEKDENEA